MSKVWGAEFCVIEGKGVDVVTLGQKFLMDLRLVKFGRLIFVNHPEKLE